MGLVPLRTIWAGSGRTKVESLFTIIDSAYGLICTETHLPLIPPAIASVMATLSEHVFSILLILGLFTAFRRMCCWA